MQAILIISAIVLLILLIYDMFRGVMKKIYQNMVEEVKSNTWELKAPRIDKFGWLPLFQLSRNCVFVVEAEPKEHLFGMIKGMVFRWKRDNPDVVQHKEGKDWVYLYNSHEKWGSIIRGCIIYTNRLDEFRVPYSIIDGVTHVEITYDVNITAKIVDPRSFYDCLKLSEQGEDLKEMIIDEIRSLIRREIERTGLPNITIEGEDLELDVLRNAGYQVEEYTIRYEERDVESNRDNMHSGHNSNEYDNIFSTR